MRDKQEVGAKAVIFYHNYDVASGSEITPCNKICKLGLSIFGKRYDVHDNVAYIMTKL